MNSTTMDMSDYGSDSVPHYLCDEIFDFLTISGAFFILIFIISAVGNTVLLCVLVKYENLKNVTNLFILNLACSDLVFTVTLPFWAYYYLHHWVFGDFFCKFVTAAYYVGLYSSIFLLTAVTVDRFIAVVLFNWPSNRVRRQKYAIGACVAAWVISIAASLSDAINSKTEIESHNTTNCVSLHDSETTNLGYYLQFSLLFFLPLVIIVFCYSAILKTVLQPSNRKRNRTVVVILCIVAAFFICWGPYNILLCIEALYKPQNCKAKERLDIAHYICQLLAYSHCCMNPLLYMLSQKLRQHLMQLLPCEKVCKKNKEGGHSTVIQNATSVVKNSADIVELQSR